MGQSQEIKVIESHKRRAVHLLILSVPALTAGALVFACTHKFGPGLSPDSANYIAAARSLLDAKGFLTFHGTAFSAWPPLYPTVLAAMKSVGLDYFFSVRCINALSLGLIIFLSGLWLLKCSGSLLLAGLCSFSILFSKPLFEISCWAWSDSFFIAVVTVFFITLQTSLRHPTVKACILLTLVTITACLTRYIGAILIPIGVLFFLVNNKQVLRKRIIFAALWATPPLLALAAWLLRNYLLTGTLAGRRFPYDITLLRNMDLAGKIIAGWFLPHQIANSVTGLGIFCLFWLFVAITLTSFFHENRKHNHHLLDSPVLTLASFLVVYTAAILFTATAVVIEPLNDRYLAPLYVPAVLLFWITLGNMYSCGGKASSAKTEIGGTSIRSVLFVGMGIGVWFAAGAEYVFARTQRSFTHGAGGVSQSRWQNSETIAWLRTRDLQGRIFSNEPSAVFLLTGRTAAYPPAVPGYYGTSAAGLREKERRISDLKSAAASDTGAYLIWFLPHWRTILCDPNQIADLCQIKTVHECKDGVIMALSPR